MKRTSANPPDAEPAGGPAAPDHERRVMRGVVHDHKDTAQLQWYDAAEDYERKLLELEEKSNPLEQGGGRGLDTRGLSVKEDDNFDPYTRSPQKDARPARGRRDLRRLSAWIRMMRELEQARK